VATLPDAVTAAVIDLLPGFSYMLGSGTYIFNSTVEVLADSALW
jgi:hypothetical protein